MVDGNIATTSRVSSRKKRRSCRYIYDRYNDAQRMVEVAMGHVVLMIELVCFSGLTERNSQLIVSCRPCSTDRAQSLQISVKRHVQEAHECEAAELSHDLYFELIKAGLFAEALCAFVELCLNGHGRPVSPVDLQTKPVFN